MQVYAFSVDFHFVTLSHVTVRKFENLVVDSCPSRKAKWQTFAI